MYRQQDDKRDDDYSKKTVKGKRKKENITKYATWNVRGIAHKVEERDSVLNEKKIKRVAIT